LLFLKTLKGAASEELKIWNNFHEEFKLILNLRVKYDFENFKKYLTNLENSKYLQQILNNHHSFRKYFFLEDQKLLVNDFYDLFTKFSFGENVTSRIDFVWMLDILISYNNPFI
jgi:hypothetical protein